MKKESEEKNNKDAIEFLREEALKQKAFGNRGKERKVRREAKMKKEFTMTKEEKEIMNGENYLCWNRILYYVDD